MNEPCPLASVVQNRAIINARPSASATPRLGAPPPAADEDKRHEADAERQGHHDAKHQRRPAGGAHAGVAEPGPDTRHQHDDDNDNGDGDRDGDPCRFPAHATESNSTPSWRNRPKPQLRDRAHSTERNSAAAFLRSSTKSLISRWRVSSSGARS